MRGDFEMDQSYESPRSASSRKTLSACFPASKGLLPKQVNAERRATIDHLASAIAEEREAFFAELDSRQEMI